MCAIYSKDHPLPDMVRAFARVGIDNFLYRVCTRAVWIPLVMVSSLIQLIRFSFSFSDVFLTHCMLRARSNGDILYLIC